MKNLKKFASLAAVVLLVGSLSLQTLAAAKYSSPAEAAAGVTGKTVEAVIEERRETGKSYGTIADDAGKLPEFKEEVLAIKKDQLDQLVKDGRVTQERADEIYKAIQENQVTCDGSGSAGIGRGAGVCFGGGCGYGGTGNQDGTGRGTGRGAGRGMGGQGLGTGGMRLQDGSCYA